MATLEELVEQFKKIPDHECYPLPEAYYEKKEFGLKKAKPASFLEAIYYNGMSLLPSTEGKIEMRGPVPGGVREIKDQQTLPVEVKRFNEETQQLEDYPAPDPDHVNRMKLLTSGCHDPAFLESYDKAWKDMLNNFKGQTLTYKQLDLTKGLWNLPKEDNKTESQPE